MEPTCRRPRPAPRRRSAAVPATTLATTLATTVTTALLALGLAPLPAVATPSPSATSAAGTDSSDSTFGNHISITARFDARSQSLVASGRLVAPDGSAMGAQLVSVSVDDSLAGGVRTDAAGRFALTIPDQADWGVGGHTIQAVYAPTDPGLGATASTTATRTTGSPTVVSANLPATMKGDAVLTVSGRVMTAAGVPVPAADVTIPARQTGSDDCTATTDGTGRFTMTCDFHLAAGRRTVTLSYGGGWSWAASSTARTIQVTAAATRASAAASGPTASTDPITPPADNAGGDAQPANPTTNLPARPPASARAVWAPLVSGRHIGLIGVGLLALLTSLAMLGRALRGDDAAETLPFIED